MSNMRARNVKIDMMENYDEVCTQHIDVSDEEVEEDVQQQQQPLAQSTPLKRKASSSAVFKIPATPMKKVSRQLPYDMSILLEKFPKQVLDNTVVNHNYTKRAGIEFPEFTFQYLRNNFVLKLNNGEPLSCFLCVNGALTIYGFNNNDVVIFNHLLRFIMKKFNVNFDTHVQVELRVNETQFIRSDRLTTYWDKDYQKIRCLPLTAFEGRVAVKVIGLQYRESQDPSNTKQTVRLMMHLEQVQVISPGDGRVENGEACLWA
jgi:hypothetical protein